jgi:hypothetical protein
MQKEGKERRGCKTNENSPKKGIRGNSNMIIKRKDTKGKSTKGKRQRRQG